LGDEEQPATGCVTNVKHTIELVLHNVWWINRFRHSRFLVSQLAERVVIGGLVLLLVTLVRYRWGKKNGTTEAGCQPANSRNLAE
jgi:hypothetical protein